MKSKIFAKLEISSSNRFHLLIILAMTMDTLALKYDIRLLVAPIIIGVINFVYFNRKIKWKNSGLLDKVMFIINCFVVAISAAKILALYYFLLY